MFRKFQQGRRRLLLRAFLALHERLKRVEVLISMLEQVLDERKNDLIDLDGTKLILSASFSYVSSFLPFVFISSFFHDFRVSHPPHPRLPEDVPLMQQIRDLDGVWTSPAVDRRLFGRRTTAPRTGGSPASPAPRSLFSASQAPGATGPVGPATNTGHQHQSRGNGTIRWKMGSEASKQKDALQSHKQHA